MIIRQQFTSNRALSLAALLSLSIPLCNGFCLPVQASSGGLPPMKPTVVQARHIHTNKNSRITLPGPEPSHLRPIPEDPNEPKLKGPQRAEATPGQTFTQSDLKRTWNSQSQTQTQPQGQSPLQSQTQRGSSVRKYAAENSPENYHPANSYESLTPEAIKMAESLGVGDDLRQLLSFNNSGVLSNDTNKGDSNTSISKSDGLLRRLLLKQSVTEAVLYQSFEVRSCLSNLETEISQADDLQAFLEEKRDRVIRLNTIANFLSGGITGIVGGALKIGDVNEQAANGIDTGEGITQTALALLALRQQAGEKKIVEGTPNMLTKLFDSEGPHTERDYPPAVWDYLTSVPENSTSGLTRQQELMKRWKDLKVINTKASAKQRNEAVGHITGTHPQPIVSIDLLDARSAMLHDVRAIVSEMDHPLLELMKVVRATKI